MFEQPVASEQRSAREDRTSASWPGNGPGYGVAARVPRPPALAGSAGIDGRWLDRRSVICCIDSNWANRNAQTISLGTYEPPTSTHEYLSTSPRTNFWRSVPLSRMMHGSLHQFRIVDTERAPFATDIVLGFMEAVCGQIAERTERAAAIERVHTLGRVFDDRQIDVDARSPGSGPFRRPRRHSARETRRASAT